MKMHITKEWVISAAVGNMLPVHDAGLEITHNPNRILHQTVAEYLEIADKPGMATIDFESVDERQEAIEMDDLWVMVWYPHTPVGSCHIGAASLGALLRYGESYDVHEVL